MQVEIFFSYYEYITSLHVSAFIWYTGHQQLSMNFSETKLQEGLVNYQMYYYIPLHGMLTVLTSLIMLTMLTMLTHLSTQAVFQELP